MNSGGESLCCKRWLARLFAIRCTTKICAMCYTLFNQSFCRWCVLKRQRQCFSEELNWTTATEVIWKMYIRIGAKSRTLENADHSIASFLRAQSIINERKSSNAWIILEKHSIFQSTITSVCFRKQYFQVYVLQKNEAKYALNEFAYSIRIAENILYPEYFRVSSFGRTFGGGVKLTVLLQHPEAHTPATVSQRCHSGDNINILKNTYWMSMVPPRAAAWSMGI